MLFQPQKPALRNDPVWAICGGHKIKQTGPTDLDVKSDK